MQRSTHIHSGRWALAGAVAATLGCSSGGNDALPTSAPTSIERIADEGFSNAGAVAVSPDGETFYVLAYDENVQPTVFSLDVASKSLEALHGGEPMLYPSDVATSCDGETLFVADRGGGGVITEIGGDDSMQGVSRPGGIYTMASTGGTPTKLDTTGLASASGVSVSEDCGALFVSGWTDGGAPALFKIPTSGGAATIIHEGEPLTNPGGLHVDADDVAWVMDFTARGEQGEGSLFAISPAGVVKPALSGVGMGRAGACSLVPGGITAIVPATDGEGKAFLISANTQTGDAQILDQPDLQYPTGVAAARSAPIMAIATENAIYTATFE